jgi:hypothetical protein
VKERLEATDEGNIQRDSKGELEGGRKEDESGRQLEGKCGDAKEKEVAGTTVYMLLTGVFVRFRSTSAAGT